ncbi:hypothetical protein LXL04_031579 [Taraxacum kok-saghyz]
MAVVNDSRPINLATTLSSKFKPVGPNLKLKKKKNPVPFPITYATFHSNFKISNMGESTCLMPASISEPNNHGNHVHALGDSVSFGRFTSESFLVTQ